VVVGVAEMAAAAAALEDTEPPLAHLVAARLLKQH
jgi:hypothetical protein